MNQNSNGRYWLQSLTEESRQVNLTTGQKARLLVALPLAFAGAMVLFLIAHALLTQEFSPAMMPPLFLGGTALLFGVVGARAVFD